MRQLLGILVAASLLFGIMGLLSYGGIGAVLGFIGGIVITHIHVRMRYGFWIESPKSPRHQIIEALTQRPEYQQPETIIRGHGHRPGEPRGR